jgi:hypothetical protein
MVKEPHLTKPGEELVLLLWDAKVEPLAVLAVEHLPFLSVGSDELLSVRMLAKQIYLNRSLLTCES